MTTDRGLVKGHPVLAYYLLTFAISWGSILLVVGGPGGIPATPGQAEQLMPIVNSLLLVGPCGAGLLMTGLFSGRAGFRELWSRLRKWRVDARWYAVALLAAPLVFTTVHLVLSLFNPAFLPAIVKTEDKTFLVVLGVGFGLVGGGLFEELGWTGFAIPKLRLRHGVYATGLIAGVLWGAWHFLVYLWGAATWAGELPVAVYVTVQAISLLVGQLPAFRVLMVLVYDRTGSLLVAMLMHASLTTWTFIIGGVSGVSGVALLAYGFVLAAVWWVIVAVVVIVNRRQVSRQTLGLAAK